MYWLSEAGCPAWCMCMKCCDSVPLVDSDDWCFGIDLVPSLPHHKFPLSVNSKKTLTVIGECQAEREEAHTITPIHTTAKMLPFYMSIQAVCRKHVRLKSGPSSPPRSSVYWATIGRSASEFFLRINRLLTWTSYKFSTIAIPWYGQEYLNVSFSTRTIIASIF